jgi:hypothetical protein
MIDMIDIGYEKAIAYRLEGKLSQEEVSRLFSLFKEKIDQGEDLILYQEVVSIGGVEFDVIVEKLKFFLDFGLSHFSRIAVVTHKKWIHKIVDLEGKLFKGIDMKGFSIDQKDKAIQFLKNDK